MSQSEDSLSFELTQSKTRILEKLQERINNYKFDFRQTELSSSYVHYPSFRIEKERIVVHRYRAAPIYIYLEEASGGKTSLRVEQKRFGSSAKTILLAFSVILFVFVYFINRLGSPSIGSALLATLIPFVIWVMVFLAIFYALGRVQNYFFTKFAYKIARSFKSLT